MREIKEVTCMIRKELRAAEWYAKESAKDKAMYPKLAQKYHTMAEDNLHRVDGLHDCVTEMIQEVKRSGREVPAGMLELWTFEHELMIEDVAEIKRILDT